MRVTLTRVYKGEQETKYGVKPKLAIKTTEHGEKWLSTFKVEGTEGYEAGKEVDIEVTVNGEYYNFTPITASNSDLEARVATLEAKVAALASNETVGDNPPF